MNKILKPVAVAVMTSTMLTGCIGSFALTDKAYTWNKKQGDKWISEGLFLVMNIIPVYSATLFLDAVIFNTVEFWTHKNPVLAGTQQKTMKTLDGSKVSMTYHANGTVDVSYNTPEGKSGAFTLTKDANTVSMLDQNGKLLAQADAEGKLIR